MKSAAGPPDAILVFGNSVWLTGKRAMLMGRGIFLAIAMAALWLLLSGFFDKGLLLFFGVCTVALSVWLSARSGVLDEESVSLNLMPGVFVYWFWLAKEIGKSNIAVARQAMAIQPTLSPKLFSVPSVATSPAGLATFANSITLTPGTVTIDLEPGYMMIHALTEELGDEAGIAEMGRRVALFERPGNSDIGAESARS